MIYWVMGEIEKRRNLLRGFYQVSFLTWLSALGTQWASANGSIDDIVLIDYCEGGPAIVLQFVGIVRPT